VKIVNRQPTGTANISSARDSTGKEFWKILLSAALLLITLYFVIGMIVGFIVPRISFETEAKIFKHFKLPAAKKQGKVAHTQLEKAKAIMYKLKSSPKVPVLPYHLVLIENEMPNAFAFPGGTIGMTTGLLDALDEEIELAFVLGHELGHFYNRDHLQGIGRAIGFKIIISYVFDGGSGADSFADIFEFVLQRGYSQDREKEADFYGLELVFAAYGKTDGVDRLFQILRNESTPEWAYMFSTHPSPRKRINDLKSYAAALQSKE